MPHTTRPRNQELTAINIDVNRNRIIRVNLYLTMASVAIASSTCVAGFFGMNLQIPETLANHPDAFAFVTGTSCLLAGITYGASLSYAQGFRRREGHNRLQDAAALQSIFENMSSIEHTVTTAVQSTGSFTKGEFTEMLQRETKREFQDREVDLVFEIFDVSRDGRVNRDEMRQVLDPRNQQQRQER